MSVKLNLLAIDLGASGGKAVLAKYDGRVIKLRKIHQFANSGVKINSNLYWDIFKLYREIKTGIKKAREVTAGRIASVGIDSWGVDYGLLDSNNCLLSFPYHYRDNRTAGLSDQMIDEQLKAMIYAETGLQFLQFNTLLQLYADLKFRPWILENTKSLLFIPDLLNFFLTGAQYNEYTIASTSQFFNPLKKDWSKVVLEKFSLPTNILNQLIYPGEVIGEILPAIKEECGIKGKLPVMAVGSHDTASAIAAIPFIDKKNSIYISSGTWSLLGIELEQPVINQLSLRENFTNECGSNRKITFHKNLIGLWLIQECKRSWNEQGLKLNYQVISKAAALAKPAKFQIDPEAREFLNPRNMPLAIKNYCHKTGQPIPEAYSEIARGIYESLALNYKKVIDKLEVITKRKFKNIHIVGGGTKAKLLTQLTANYTGKKVITGPVEATSIGNILAQLLAGNEIESIEEGRDIVQNSVELEEFYPKKGVNESDVKFN